MSQLNKTIGMSHHAYSVGKCSNKVRRSTKNTMENFKICHKRTERQSTTTEWYRGQLTIITQRSSN